MITGFILAWTGWMVTVLNQQETPYCSTFAVATCAQLYGKKLDPIKMAWKLKIGEEGLMPDDLRKLPYGITSPKHLNVSRTGDIVELLQKGPLIFSVYGNIFGEGHGVCAVGYSNLGWIVSANFGTGYLAQGYTYIPYTYTGIQYQKITGLGVVKTPASFTGVVRGK